MSENTNPFEKQAEELLKTAGEALTSAPFASLLKDFDPKTLEKDYGAVSKLSEQLTSTFKDVAKTALPELAKAALTSGKPFGASLFDAFPLGDKAKSCDCSCFCTGECFDFGNDADADDFSFSFDTNFGPSKVFGAVRAIETEKGYEVTVALPGITKDADLKAFVQSEVLHIELNVSETESVNETFIDEYAAESFTREIELPNVDAKTVKATLANGELKITVNKVKEIVTNITIK